MHLGVIFEVLMCDHAVATTYVVCTNGLELKGNKVLLSLGPTQF